MSVEEARELGQQMAQEIVLRRSAVDELRAQLFDKQIAFIDDPSRFKTNNAGRRGGKTQAIVHDHCISAIKHPGTNSLYTCLTKPTAIDQVWPEFERIAIRHGATFDNVRHIVKWPNRSRIFLGGVEKREEREKFRGGKFKKITLDEFGSYSASWVQSFMDDIVEPTLTDYQGSLTLAGTPPPAGVGYYHDRAHDKTGKYSNHHWTYLDNPRLPFLDGNPEWRKIAKEAWDKQRESTPPVKFRREYGGEWIRDQDSLLFLLDPTKNVYSDLPHEDFEYIMALDTGWRDATAIVVLGVSRVTNAIYLVHEFSKPKLVLDQVAKEIVRIRDMYKPAVIIADPAQKQFVESLAATYSIAMIAADKQNKRTHIDEANSALYQGRVRFPKGSETYDQMARLEWNSQRTRESESYPCDLADSVIYGLTYAFNHLLPSVAPPKQTREERIRREVEEWREKHVARLQKKGDAWEQIDGMDEQDLAPAGGFEDGEL